MKETARTVALDALLQMEQNDGYSNLVIDKALKEANLDRRDAALCSAIFYGVLEKRLTLDYYLDRCLREPGKKMDKTAKMALRCGAYQILYLDRVPDSAAVNETVNAVKAGRKAALAGLVNGVLRNLIRQKESLSLPEGNGLHELSVRYSVPEGLISLWQKAYGPETTVKLLKAFQEKPELYIRVNTLRTGMAELNDALSQRGIELEELAAPKGCAILKNCGDPAALLEFADGLYHVQDLSAQAVCEVLDPRPGETVIDCCAAPGGKTFTLSERMGNRGRVLALDLYPARVRLIAEGANRLGIVNISTKALDMTKPLKGLPMADKVLCDVPCSGFGVIRRKPEIRGKNLQELRELPALQYEILRSASSLVKPGGALLYSTCTLNPAENGEVAERFLRETNGFTPRKIDVPAGFSRCVEEPEHHLTIMPFAGGSDGFFAAMFQRKS